MSSSSRGLLYCIIGAVTWGINGVVIQFLFMNYTVDSSWVSATRMLISGIILLIMFYPKEKTLFTTLLHDPISIRHMIVFSIFGLIFSQYAYLSAIKYSNSGTATVLQTLSVVIMAFYVALRFRKKPSCRERISVILAFLGVFLIATDGNLSTMVLSPLGLMWGLLSAIGVVTYPILSQGLVAQWGTGAVNSLGMLIGGALFTVSMQLWNAIPTLDIYGWAAILFISIIGTALTYTAFIQGIRLIGPMKATLLCTLEPVVASIVSSLCLGTIFTFIEIIGFICIITTVFLIILKKEQQ